jgi:hypothetical protein
MPILTIILLEFDSEKGQDYLYEKLPYYKSLNYIKYQDSYNVLYCWLVITTKL